MSRDQNGQFSNNMVSQLRLLIIALNVALVKSAFILQDRHLKIPDYDYFWNDNMRKAFVAQKPKNQEYETTQSELQNGTIFVDTILHDLIDRNNSKWHKINTFEYNYKQLISMKGVKYTYKRDWYWRTWRRVNHPNTDIQVVCYRCEHRLKPNCTNCNSGGYWVIEENPPCPYEFFSITKEDQLCTANFSQYEDKNSSCATVMRIENIIHICDNPIETTWRITKVYNTRDAEQSGTDICEGRENCEISTVYAIFKNYVIFRIINSNNVIIYSRVMKKGGKNYACVEDCGYRDPKTMTVTKEITPLDLISASNKRKRENKLTDEKETQTKKITTQKQLGNYKDTSKIDSLEKLQTTTMSICKKLSLRKSEIEDSERDYEY